MDLKRKFRGQFIGQANCAAVGDLPCPRTFTTLVAGATSASNFTDYKALVCLFLNGGNDSFICLFEATKCLQ